MLMNMKVYQPVVPLVASWWVHCPRCGLNRAADRTARGANERAIKHTLICPLWSNDPRIKAYRSKGA